MHKMVAVRLWPKRFRNCRYNFGSPYQRVAMCQQDCL